MPQLIQPHQRILHAALLSLVVAPNALFAATVGGVQKVDFSPTVVSNFCDITTQGGSLGVERKRSLITSDSAELGSFVGSRAPGTIAVVSNLSNSGSVVVDPPSLTGGTTPGTSELKLNTGSYGSAAQTLNLDADGNIAKADVHVRFTTTNNSKFANGTYSAAATVTCTDDGKK